MRGGFRGRTAIAAMMVIGAGALSACGGSSGASDSAKELKLGFFPNVTHATALVGVERGIFADKLGKDVKLTTAQFNAGPSAVEALFSKGVDATFIGPNPAINAWAKSKGKAIKIISGSASGGASLVVRSGIDSVDDLKGKKIATPQLGNTQDVAARHYFKSKGFKVNEDGSGDIKIVPQENSQTIDTFEQGAIDGAWVPEPFASRLVLEGKGKRLLNEKDLWPGGRFVVTHLIVRTEFAERNPALVRKLVEGTVESSGFIESNPAEAKKAVNAQLTKLSGKPISTEVLDATFEQVDFTVDPIATSLFKGAEHAEEVGLLEPVDLKGIYDLSVLNDVLRAAGKPKVSDA